MSPQELEQCILRPEIDGTLGTLIQKLLQKPNAFDNDKAWVSNNSRTNSHHIPILNDMKEYKNWNEKLARKMSFMHKLYKRFIVKYDLKWGKLQDENSKDTGYSSEILKHLINYDETDCSMRFLHEDMKIFDSETLAIVKLFEEMDGRNPFTSKSTIEVLPLDNPENCDNSNHEGDIIEKNYEEEPWDDEEFILWMHEIPIKFRADVILFLCSLKADTEEFSKHIKKIEEDEAKQRVTTRSKSLKDNKKAANDNVSEDISNNSKNKVDSEDDESTLLDTEPIYLGIDLKKNWYFYFDKHWDWRVYTISNASEFALVWNSPEELKMLITSLTTEDENAANEANEAKLKEESMFIFKIQNLKMK